MENNQTVRPEISVIIPVHNGCKFLERTVSGVLRQTHRDLEVILVENGSTDGSLALCRQLEKLDARVIVLHSDTKGTSLARKAGIEHARGRYILFSDQDDTYINDHAIQGMYDAITADRVQICQFGYYKHYILGLRRELRKTEENEIFTRDSHFADTVSGIAGIGGSKFDTSVWNKIYDSKVLKNAVVNIDVPLYFAEDEYLNLWAFFNPDTQSVSVRTEAYYVWNVGTGFSATKASSDRLFKDYAYVRPVASKLLKENDCSNKTLFHSHLETLYFFKFVIDQMILQKENPADIKAKILEMDAYDYVRQAKAYFLLQPAEELWDDLKFLASAYSADEYYNWCASHRPKQSIKTKLVRVLGAIKRRFSF